MFMYYARTTTEPYVQTTHPISVSDVALDFADMLAQGMGKLISISCYQRVAHLGYYVRMMVALVKPLFQAQMKP